MYKIFAMRFTYPMSLTIYPFVVYIINRTLNYRGVLNVFTYYK